MPSLLADNYPYRRRNVYTPTGADVRKTAGNLAANTLGLFGDIQGMTPFLKPLVPLPNSEQLAQKFGGDVNHPSYIPTGLLAPGPGELATGAKLAAKGLLNYAPEAVGPGGLLHAMTLFHGTPHKFDMFDLSKIGTGEGAQAYGHGLYFAQDPGVAGTYRTAGRGMLGGDGADVLIDGKSLRDIRLPEDSPEVLGAGSILDPMVGDAGDIPGTIEALRRGGRQFDDPRFTAAADWLEKNQSKIEVSNGHLYEVDIPDETIDKMLDWDAPLSEQPESVRKLLNDALDETLGERGESQLRFTRNAHGKDVKQSVYDLRRNDATGGQIYDYLASHHGSLADVIMDNNAGNMRQGPKAASDRLSQLGIPGIRFWDGGSRSKVLSRQGFYNKFDYHTDLRGRKSGTAAKNRESIMREGFRQGAFNRVPAHMSEASPGMAGQYAPQAGDTVYIIPSNVQGKSASGRPSIPKGWKPGGPDGGMVVELKDGEDLYDAYVRSTQGTRNIVVFNPDDIREVKRDGELVYKR